MSVVDQRTDAAIASVEEQFGAMYRQVKASMRRRASQVHPELQVMGYVILSTLAKGGPTHAGVLAERLDIDKGLLSRQLQSLEKLGLLERQPDPADKRAMFLTASAAAVRSVEEVRRTDLGVLHNQLRGWEVEDLEKLAELLGRVNTLS